MAKHEIKQHIDVDGVILTQKAINRLIILQEHNNEMLKDSVRCISDVICLVEMHRVDLVDDEVDEVNTLLNELSIIRRNFNELARP